MADKFSMPPCSADSMCSGTKLPHSVPESGATPVRLQSSSSVNDNCVQKAGDVLASSLNNNDSNAVHHPTRTTGDVNSTHSDLAVVDDRLASAYGNGEVVCIHRHLHPNDAVEIDSNVDPHGADMHTACNGFSNNLHGASDRLYVSDPLLSTANGETVCLAMDSQQFFDDNMHDDLISGDIEDCMPAVSETSDLSDVDALAGYAYGGTTASDGLDFGLDDYIDTDLHLSPVAGSVSPPSSPSSLSDDGVAISNHFHSREQSVKCEQSANFSSPGFSSSCVNATGFMGQQFSHYKQVYCAASGEKASLLTKQQASNHALKNSVDMLPAVSDVRPCDSRHLHRRPDDVPVLASQPARGNISQCSSQSRHHLFDTAPVSSSQCGPTQHRQTEVYWLPLSGNSDTDSPCSDIADDSGLSTLQNFHTADRPVYFGNGNVVCCCSNGVAVSSRNGLFHESVGCGSSHNNGWHESTKPTTLPLDVNGCQHTDLQNRDDNSLQFSSRLKACSNGGGRGQSMGTDVVPCNAQQSGTRSSKLLAMRLSTSLTLENSHNECDKRLTQSFHQSSSDSSALEMDEIRRRLLATNIGKSNGSDHSLTMETESAGTTRQPSAQAVCHGGGCFSHPVDKVSSCMSPSTAVNAILETLDLRVNKPALVDIPKQQHSQSKSKLFDFLLHCSSAEPTAEEIIDYVTKITDGHCVGKFFRFKSARHVHLAHCLAYWLQLGAAPVLTVKCDTTRTGDSTGHPSRTWHHLAVEAVYAKGILIKSMLPPGQVVSEEAVLSWLAADSTVEVNRTDIVSRWQSTCNLNELVSHPEPAWQDHNVLGQVVNILRESRLPSDSGYRPQQTSRLVLPTAMQSGVTLFASATNLALRERLEQIDSSVVFALPSLHFTRDQPQDAAPLADDEGNPSDLCCSTKDTPKLPSAKVRRKKKLPNS